MRNALRLQAPRRWLGAIAMLSRIAVSFVAAASVPAQETAFEQANKLYEQGKFAEAATVYQRLAETNGASPAVQFNLGNAWFKAGQIGRAIAAWRAAERLAPRDPDVAFNLKFARKQVSGGEPPAVPWSRRLLGSVTLNGWSVAAAAAFWTLFLLLTLREGRPLWHRPLLWPIALAAVAFLSLTTAAVLAHRFSREVRAVVVVPQAVARYGPLDDSQVYYQLRDGSETAVVDEQPGTADRPAWVRIQDASRRLGWVKQDQVILLR